MMIASVAFGQIHYPMEDPTGSDFIVLSTEDTDFSDGWNDVDADVQFGINYETISVGSGFPAGIPEAPNTQPGDAPRTGMFVSANDDILTNIVGISEVALVPVDADTGQALSITGKYEVQVDIWMNFDKSSANATEFGGLLVGHDGATQGRLTGGGLVYSGDSGALSDFRLQHGPASGAGDPLSGATGFHRISFDDDGPGSTVTNTDGRYNPEIGQAYVDDPQRDPNLPVSGALDNENDFWQEIATDRSDVGAALSPINSQGATQSGPPSVNNPPGDFGFRWGTVRIEVDPDEIGTGNRQAAGVARVYLSATWNDVEDGVPFTTTGPEKLVGKIDNSIDSADATGATPAVLDFSDPIAFVYADLFPSFEGSGWNFGVFDNLIITPESTGGLEGDINGDGEVDLLDLDILGSNFGSTPATLGEGDLNGDNVVDLLDLDILGSNFGASINNSLSIPEPTSIVLLFASLVANGTLRRRR